MQQRQLGRLFFLDGIRGWAALSVVLYHLLPTFVLTTDQQRALQWVIPPADGELAVYVFFVVSGFSLSIAFVRTASKQVIASLAVRRYPRLMIPVLCASLIGYAMMRAGLNNAPQLAAMTGHTNWPASAFQFQPSVVDAVRFGTWGVFFNYEPAHSYSPVLWTMAVEMMGSAMILGVFALLGKSAMRWAAYVALWTGLALTDSPLSAFVAGAVLAEIHDSAPMVQIRQSGKSKWLSAAAIAAVWYVSAGQRHLYSSATAISLLGTALVIAVVISETCTSAMEARISRQLGRLSFPLYLTHTVVLCIVGARIGIWLLQVGANAYAVAGIEVMIVVPLCLLFAMLFAPIESFAINSGRKIAAVARLSVSH